MAIESFKHKGLKKFWLTGSTAGINKAFASKIKATLTVIDAAETKQEIEHIIGKEQRLHEHKGKDKGRWSLDISGNYRLLFRFKDNKYTDIDIVKVDFDDIH